MTIEIVLNSHVHHEDIKVNGDVEARSEPYYSFEINVDGKRALYLDKCKAFDIDTAAIRQLENLLTAANMIRRDCNTYGVAFFRRTEGGIERVNPAHIQITTEEQ